MQAGIQTAIYHTVSREIFVEIFSDRLISAKIKRTKIVRINNANACGTLSENYLFIARNIFDMKLNIRDLQYIHNVYIKGIPLTCYFFMHAWANIVNARLPIRIYGKLQSEF